MLGKGWGGVPVRHVLVRVSVGDIEHDDGALAADTEGGQISEARGVCGREGGALVAVAKTSELMVEVEKRGGKKG